MRSRFFREFHFLTAPDGSLPWPESSGTWVKNPVDIVRSDVICLRWGEANYLLVFVEPYPWGGNRWNLHAKPSCGYFALMINGEWKVRCRPYEGWSPWKVPFEDGLLFEQLPPGAVLPTWRIKPPKIRVVTGSDHVEIVWDSGTFFNVSRVLYWDNQKVTCEDRWGAWRKRVRRWSI